jgi:hypothetical protein
VFKALRRLASPFDALPANPKDNKRCVALRSGLAATDERRAARNSTLTHQWTHAPAAIAVQPATFPGWCNPRCHRVDKLLALVAWLQRVIVLDL